MTYPQWFAFWFVVSLLLDMRGNRRASWFTLGCALANGLLAIAETLHLL